MTRFAADDLTAYAIAVMRGAGLSDAHAQTTAQTLVAADLLGYVTHGIQFLPQYCSALEDGAMTAAGSPTIVSDNGTTLVYDGGMLPGPCCIGHALEDLIVRARDHGMVAGVIRHSTNTACLATYLLPIVEAGLIGMIMVSSPGGRVVAPAGGREGRFSTNPLAFGFPTGGDPVLIDMATSATTNRLTEKMQREGDQYSEEPLLDSDGSPTNDPFALTKANGGTIRPLGGDANEHKGFALALAVQAMSAALSGGGGSTATGDALGTSTFIQLMDPGAFAGGSVFAQEMDRMIDMLIATPPRPNAEGVRVPGQRAMAAYRRQSRDGIEISDALRRHVEPLAAKYGVTFPLPLD